MSAPTDKIRDELLRILQLSDPRQELEAWCMPHMTTTGQEEYFYRIAENYVTYRRHDLEAIADGYTKHGLQVVAFVESLKSRVPGPPEPDVHQLPEHQVVVYLWHTKSGPKLVAFQRAPEVDTRPRWQQRAQPAHPSMLYFPHYWRQLKVVELQESGQVLLGDVLTWEVPGRQGKLSPPPDTSLDYKLQVPCMQPGCEASAGECGHQTLSERAGFRLPDQEDMQQGAERPLKFCPCGKSIDPRGPDLCSACVSRLQKPKHPSGSEADEIASGQARVLCRECSAKEPGGAEVYHLPGQCGVARGERTPEVSKPPFCGVCEGSDPASVDLPHYGHHPECILALQDPGGPVHYDSTEFEPSNGWTNTPVDPGDPRIGTYVETSSCGHLRAATKEARKPCDHPAWCGCQPSCGGPDFCQGCGGPVAPDSCWGPVDKCNRQPPAGVVHCPGSWVPPGDEVRACAPVPSESEVVFYAHSVEDLQAHLPKVTCGPCRQVMEAVMRAGRWLGPDLHAKGRGWLEALQPELLDRAKENMHETLSGSTPAGSPDALRDQDAVQSLAQGENGEANGVECQDEETPSSEPAAGGDFVPRDKAGHSCRCGHVKFDHALPEDGTVGECLQCPCVAFRDGESVEFETQEEREALEVKKLQDFVRSLDMENVTRQRTAKEYDQCRICREVIDGPKKEGKKIVTPGHEWVAPKEKRSMGHRSHLSCADRFLEELKAKA